MAGLPFGLGAGDHGLELARQRLGLAEGGPVGRAHALEVARGDIGAGIQQQLHHAAIARIRGHHQRSGAVGRRRIDQRLLAQQHARGLQPALRGRIVQRRPAQPVDLRAARDQRLRAFGLPRHRQVHQGRLARGILGVEIGAAVGGQHIEHLPGVVDHRPHDGRLAIVVAHIGIGARRQQGADVASLVVMDIHPPVGLLGRPGGAGQQGAGEQAAGRGAAPAQKTGTQGFHGGIPPKSRIHFK
ncbi:Uncharacterised protein [Bordetella pertussis]|nr:Uncharacterised protein [Bordetella pertussis]CFN22459.1 Uncharacterised protein [Bordetella pertussis]CFP14753.1 Uncharacterised protein [Bordetella pertussis]CPL35573.1 Uncharacterised protein [Bordetella pertussis]CPQ92388.1 Uncharacterised protein [Bordetella pertussis]